jgi:septal ring factor EnvC (AmiA/AmiB activator)
MKKAIFFISIIFLAGTIMHAQQPNDEKGQMEKERLQIQKEISDLQKAYTQIKGQKNVTLGQANVLKRKIELQERYLNNINREIRFINDDIYRSTLEINKLNRQLDTLKTQYARSVVYAYKNRSTYDFLNFIFSATNFNDALKRVAYLKSYRSYREQQVNNIRETQKLIAKRKVDQLGKAQEKKIAQENQTKQVEILEDQKKEKDVVIAQLKSKEKDIQKQLSLKKKRDNDLKNAILAIVKREAKKAEDEAKRNANLNAKTNTNTSENVTTTIPTKPITTTPRSYLDLNASDVKLNASFSNNRGRLPWPVDNGVVSIHFGSYEIEGTKLRGSNPGITISTPSAGVPVKSVFEGEVAGVYNMGDGMAVTIRHGKYFTTYSNLSAVSVNKGSTVSTGQQIGRAGKADDANGGQIDFILMVETKNVNPEPWLRR